MSHGWTSLRLHRMRQEFSAQGKSPFPHAFAQQGQQRRKTVQMRSLPEGLYVQGSSRFSPAFAFGRETAQLSGLRKNFRREGQHVATFEETRRRRSAYASHNRFCHLAAGCTADTSGRCTRRTSSRTAGTARCPTAHRSRPNTTGSSRLLLKQYFTSIFHFRNEPGSTPGIHQMIEAAQLLYGIQKTIKENPDQPSNKTWLFISLFSHWSESFLLSRGENVARQRQTSLPRCKLTTKWHTRKTNPK